VRGKRGMRDLPETGKREKERNTREKEKWENEINTRDIKKEGGEKYN